MKALKSLVVPGRVHPAVCAGVAAVLALAGCGSDRTGPTPTVAVSFIAVDSGPVVMERGQQRVFTATVLDDKGKRITVPVVWRSQLEAVAAFQPGGRLVALDTGQTYVTASSLGITSAPVAVRVEWVGAARIETSQWTAPSAATPGATAADSVRVLVTNRFGTPVPGAQVAFQVTAGNGVVSPATVRTGSNGIAAARWTLGPVNGANTLTAAVVDSSGQRVSWVRGNPVTFTVTTYTALAPVEGDAQVGQILSALPIAPAIKVLDTTGKPRAGVPVTFTATSGGRVETAIVSTGANGVASPGTWTLGDIPGEQTLIARVESAVITLRATATGTPIYYMPTRVVAGVFASCAINGDGTVSCWGQAPQIGTGDTISRSKPTPTSADVKFTATALAGGPSHFCAIGTDKAAYCWGVNALTDTAGKVETTLAPTRMPSVLSWTQVAPGFAHNCGIATDLLVYCWGDNSVGQLGDRTTTTRFVPTAVNGGFHFASLTSGTGHSCGLTTDGAAFCWGLNQSGQLGDGTTTNRTAPTAVSGGLAFKAIGAGESWTCGLTTAGAAYCWGNLPTLSAPQASPQAYPTSTATFTSLSVGGAHACALTSDGTAYCWGNNAYGQLGDSSLTTRSVPTAVAGGLHFSSISAGYAHTCARTLAGEAACWGFNRAGEIGDTTATAIRVTPRRIVTGVKP